VCCSVLQCVAVCCSVLQCVAVCCSVLQCVAVCCRVLQRVAVCHGSPHNACVNAVGVRDWYIHPHNTRVNVSSLSSVTNSTYKSITNSLYIYTCTIPYMHTYIHTLITHVSTCHPWLQSRTPHINQSRTPYIYTYIHSHNTRVNMSSCFQYEIVLGLSASFIGRIRD